MDPIWIIPTALSSYRILQTPIQKTVELRAITYRPHHHQQSTKAMDGKHNNMTMAQIWNSILNQAAKQGFSTILLLVAAFVIYTQNTKLQIKVDSCMDAQLQYHRDRAEKSDKIIQDFTESLRFFTATIEHKKD